MYYYTIILGVHLSLDYLFADLHNLPISAPLLHKLSQKIGTSLLFWGLPRIYGMEMSLPPQLFSSLRICPVI